MKNILKRFLLVTQYVTSVLGIWCILNGIEGKYYDFYGTLSLNNYFFFGIGLLILVPVLKYIFIGQFLIFPWSKEKEGSDKTRKEVLKRLLILTHYGIFLFGIMLFIGGVYEMIHIERYRRGGGDLIFFGIGTWILGSTLNYIFLGKFLIFPWLIDKVDK